MKFCLDKSQTIRIFKYTCVRIFRKKHALVQLAQAVGSAGNVTGLDISAGMMKKAERRLRKAR